MSGDLNITAEELKLFEEFYRRRLAEAGQVRDDSEELAVARDILQAVVNDGLTPTADGGASYVRRGARDWTDPTTVQAAQATLAGSSDTGGRKGKKRKNGRPTAGAPVGGPARGKEMLQGLGMLAAVLAIAGWFLWPTLFSQAEKGEDNQDGNSTANVSAQAAEGDESGEYTLKEAGAEGLVGPGTPAPTLETALLADIIDAGGVKTGPVVPRTLEIKGVSYIVQPVLVQAGDWPRPEDPRAASWVYGTVVNYVLGLEATPENKKLLASLSPGDEILLRTSTGPTYRFAYADAVRVSPQASEIFAQVRPGLIIALLGDEGQPDRIIIRAVYLPGRSDGGSETAPVTVVSLGETTQIGESLRLTCLGYEPRVPPGVPPGYVHLEVHFAVENRLDDTLMTNTFAHQVIVADLTYPAITHLGTSQAASARPAGTYPGLPASLAKGQVFTSTAIYAIPEVALKEELLWQFAPDPAGQTIQVLLPPYRGTLEPTVSVKSIEMQEGGLLAIKFALQAPDLHALEISATDLKVEGAALAPAGNAFPWRLAAGERDEFSLLMIPEISPVTVGLLGQGFEITWRGGGG
jgi:hypothetical protein